MSRHATIFTKRLMKHIVFSALLEFSPVLLFLISYQFLKVYEAIMVLMIATIISTVLTYRLQKRIPYLALYVATITIIFGYKTLHKHDIKFIQIRDTLYDATCALTLMIGMIANIKFLKIAFDEVLPMADHGWKKLTYLWIFFFAIAASLNETVRKVFSVDTWFVYKGCMMAITSIFGIFALYVSYEPKKTH